MKTKNFSFQKKTKNSDLRFEIPNISKNRHSLNTTIDRPGIYVSQYYIRQEMK